MSSNSTAVNADLRGKRLEALLTSGERWAFLPEAQWTACILVGACGLAIAVAATQAWQVTAGDRRAAEVDLERAQAIPIENATAQADTPLAAVHPDFAQAQPRSVDVRALLTDIQRLASRGGLVLSAVQIQARPPSFDRLARADLTLSLRGSYVDLKQLCADLLDRYPNVTLARLTIRKATTPRDLESTVVFVAWGAPADGVEGQTTPRGR